MHQPKQVQLQVFVGEVRAPLHGLRQDRLEEMIFHARRSCRIQRENSRAAAAIRGPRPEARSHACQLRCPRRSRFCSRIASSRSRVNGPGWDGWSAFGDGSYQNIAVRHAGETVALRPADGERFEILADRTLS